METEHWAVGELAKVTGLTVRTVRYWDELGLVSPSRTAAGHRSYDRADVARLYRVPALREMGLGLHEVAALLSAHLTDVRGLLRAHLAHVDAELRAAGPRADKASAESARVC